MPKKDIVIFDLDDVYRAAKLNRKVKQYGLSIFLLSFVSGILMFTAYEQERRIDELEKRLKRTEMAG